MDYCSVESLLLDNIFFTSSFMFDWRQHMGCLIGFLVVFMLCFTTFVLSYVSFSETKRSTNMLRREVNKHPQEAPQLTLL